jgi:hypothetical protein
MSTTEYKSRLETRWAKYQGFGEAHGLREWARLLRLPHGSVSRYLQKGLTIEEVARLRGVKYPR